ncbi:hypothetical protein V5F77_20790 [Xanthobacter sp. DSM 24535]|uniref:alginate O-acetyltransferase AlgX-related protein n=1 Tax=Roseixanthobacter psychrophilus TaxID=3119917 RepID=UPI00372B2FCC
MTDAGDAGKIENDVLRGQEGWLFLIGGSNSVGELMQNPATVLADKVDSWQRTLRQRQERMAKLGAQYLHFWVPDKLSVYRDVLPPCFSLPTLTPTSFVLGSDPDLNSIAMNLEDSFAREKKAAPLFWKTDTHWTYEGAFSAYKEFCKRVGAAPKLGLLDRPFRDRERVLDLGSKLNPLIKEIYRSRQVSYNSHIVFENEVVKFLKLLKPQLHGEIHGGASVEFQNESNNCDKRRIILFGDSFSGYGTASFTALLAETFSSVLFVWSPNIDYDLVSKFAPDIVLSEMAERFISRVPCDDININDFVFNKIAQFLNKKLISDESGGRFFSSGRRDP